MDIFQQFGDAMLLAQEGQRQMAGMLGGKIRSMIQHFKAWQAAMPRTLPPTESQPR